MVKVGEVVIIDKAQILSGPLLGLKPKCCATVKCFPPALLPTGDILALSIRHLDSLVQMPLGCGEQNMIHFAPSIYVLQYLDMSSQDNKEIRSRALGYMMEGKQPLHETPRLTVTVLCAA